MFLGEFRVTQRGEAKEASDNNFLRRCCGRRSAPTWARGAVLVIEAANQPREYP